MRLKIAIISSLALICLFACEQKSNTKPKSVQKWDYAKYNSKISLNPIFEKLDQEKELYGIFDSKDSILKRSSSVAYFSKAEDTIGNKYYRFNKCKARMTTDTLYINIGMGSGFSGSGSQIKYFKKKFYIEPYHWTDASIGKEFESTYKLNWQSLILDKVEYKIGDSIFGRIEFESIEIDFNKKQTIKKGKGYFRGEIKMG